MARLLQQLVEDPRPCSYLGDRKASLEHRVLVDVSPEELEHLIVRGFRRFGPDYFRPACGACSACVPTRIPTATFAPSKSQRRAARNASVLAVRLGTPAVDDERLDLYHRWHATREAARGWEPAYLDEETYAFQLAFPHPASRELTYWEQTAEGERLVGVALCDETPRAWSAIYFFYEPAWAPRSIGVANVVFQVALARSRGLAHLYLGYRVSDCPSMRYKLGFRPQERLSGWPGTDEEPVWVAVDEAG